MNALDDDLVNAETEAAAGALAAQPHVQQLDDVDIDAAVLAARRADRVVEIHDLELWQAVPARPRGTTNVHTVGGFLADYTRRQCDGDRTAVYTDAASRTVTAIYDDDDTDGIAGWRDYRTVLNVGLTDSWQHWTDNAGVWHTQEAFGDVIEDGELDLTEPSSVDLIEMAHTFRAQTITKMRRQATLAGGRTQYSYEEETTGGSDTGDAGLVTFPDRFGLSLVPYVGMDPDAGYTVVARLKWRINDGKPQFLYRLLRVDDVLREAFTDGIVDNITPELDPPAPVIDGAAPGRTRARA